MREVCFWLLALAVCSCRGRDAGPPSSDGMSVPFERGPATAGARNADDTSPPADGGETERGSVRLVTELPSRVGELESALEVRFDEALPAVARGGDSFLLPAGNGVALSDDVARASVRFDWDVHHSRPVSSIAALRARSMLDYSLRFTRGRERYESALRAKYGPSSRRVGKVDADAGPVAAYRQYGPFYVDAKETDAFSLEWFATTPEWAAIPAEPNARRLALVTLVAGLNLQKAADAQDATALAGAAGRTSGVVAKGSLNSGDQWIELVPPMAAVDFVDACGFVGAAAQSTDAHQSHWRVVVPAPSGQWALPKAGRWTIEASLVAPPSGATIDAGRAPSLRKKLGPADRVRYIRIARS